MTKIFEKLEKNYENYKNCLFLAMGFSNVATGRGGGGGVHRGLMGREGGGGGGQEWGGGQQRGGGGGQ